MEPIYVLIITQPRCKNFTVSRFTVRSENKLRILLYIVLDLNINVHFIKLNPKIEFLIFINGFLKYYVRSYKINMYHPKKKVNTPTKK